MHLKTTLIALALGAVAAAGVSGAASAQPIAHPRQHEVMARDMHQRQQIKAQLATGHIAPAKAHHLMTAERRLSRHEHRMFAANGGYLTKAQQRHLNRQENRLERHIRG
jgi:hypothetical protein